MANHFLDAALEYREAGLHPIPLLPRSKRPLVPWREYQERMPTVEEIQGWWAVCPDANVAIVLGRGAFAVDVDGPDAEAALKAAGIDLGRGPSSKTSRGRHVFFAGASPDKIGLLTHVDVRGVGYVVAPPSVHESGHIYRWEVPITGPLPEPPAALMALLAEKKPRAAATQEKWLSLALEGVGEGTRDVTCYKLAAYFVSKGIPQDVIESLLFLWADQCEPPFPHDQVVIKVQSAAKHEPEPEGPPVGLAEALDTFVKGLSTPPEARKVAPTELPSLDRLLDGGFSPGDLVYLGARPGVGKSALALQISRRSAAKRGVLYVSREMPAQALVRRLVSQASHVSLSSLKTGELETTEKKLIEMAAGGLRDLKLWISTSIVSTEQLATALDAYTPGDLGLVVVDYLQLMKPAEHIRDPRARVEAVSEELKRLAVRHELPFLVLSSLSRPEKKAGANWRPSLSDLRESGELEHDADTVIFLHRELTSPHTELILAKQRDGEVGSFPLQFRGQTVTFTEGQ